MAQPRPLLERLLQTPDLAKIVPQLPADVLHRVIRHCGLEDCADVVALATPTQLARILDADVWRVRTAGIRRRVRYRSLAGCTIQDRALTVQEASEAVLAACNLGLENWPDRWRSRDLITAFQVGWSVLHRDVCLHAAARLIGIDADIRTSDRAVQLRLSGLRRALTPHLRDGAPWRARQALDVILMLDAPFWAGLLCLIDECPVLHASVAASGHSYRAIKPADFEFIGQNRQIGTVRVFLASLPSALTR